MNIYIFATKQINQIPEEVENKTIFNFKMQCASEAHCKITLSFNLVIQRNAIM